MKAYTPAELRTLAGSQRTNPFFVDQTAAALTFAANALEAADKALRVEIDRVKQSAAMPNFEVLTYMTESNDGLMFWDSDEEAYAYCDDDVEPEKLIRQSDVVAAWAAAINPTGGTKP